MPQKLVGWVRFQIGGTCGLSSLILGLHKTAFTNNIVLKGSNLQHVHYLPLKFSMTTLLNKIQEKEKLRDSPRLVIIASFFPMSNDELT